MARDVLKREEWDFSLCPDEHLEACYFYEFARESEKSKASERVHREQIESAADEYEAESLTNNRLLHVFNFHKSCPEFPETPFLLIPTAERTKRIASLWNPAALRQANLSTIIRTHTADHSQSKTLKYRTGYSEGAIEEGVIAAFYIDWNIALPNMAKGFRQWLEDNKPPGACVGAKNGGGSTRRQQQTRLKALGALRLLRRMSWEEAYLHSKESRKDKHARPWPLFSNYASVWENAQKDGEEARRRVGRIIESLI